MAQIKTSFKRINLAVLGARFRFPGGAGAAAARRVRGSAQGAEARRAAPRRQRCDRDVHLPAPRAPVGSPVGPRDRGQRCPSLPGRPPASPRPQVSPRGGRSASGRVGGWRVVLGVRTPAEVRGFWARG